MAGLIGVQQPDPLAGISPDMLQSLISLPKSVLQGIAGSIGALGGIIGGTPSGVGPGGTVGAPNPAYAGATMKIGSPGGGDPVALPLPHSGDPADTIYGGDNAVAATAPPILPLPPSPQGQPAPMSAGGGPMSGAVPPMPQMQAPAAAPAQATGMTGAPPNIPQMQAPQSGGIAPPPAPPTWAPRNGIGDVLDNVFLGGAIQRARNFEHSTQLANYNQQMGQYHLQQLMAYGNSLPSDQRAAFYADPAGYLTSRNANVSVKPGETELGPAAGANGVFTAGSTGINASTNQPYAVAPQTFALGPNGPVSTGGGGFAAGPAMGSGKPDVAPNGVVTGIPTPQNPTGVIGAASETSSTPLPGQSITTQPAFTPNGAAPAGAGYTWNPNQPSPAAPPLAPVQSNGPIVVQRDPNAPPPPPTAFRRSPATLTQAAPPATGAGGYAWPIQAPHLTSGFGTRPSPMAGASTNHPGDDLRAAKGTTVGAAAPGTVVLAGPDAGYGNAVVIQHPDGRRTIYGHLTSVNVKPGDTVAAGQPVGLSGSTGLSTAPHLHFGITATDGHTWVDPQSVLGRLGGGPSAASAPAQAGPQTQTIGSGAGGMRGSVTSTAAPTFRIVHGGDPSLPNSDPNLDYKVAPNGDMTPIPRSVTAQDVVGRGQSFMSSESYKDGANVVTAMNGLSGALNTVSPSGAVSMATMDSALRTLNPGLGVRGQALTLNLEHMGLPHELAAKYQEFMGQGFMPADVAAQYYRVAYNYARAHLGLLEQQHEANQRWAKGAGYDPSMLGETVPNLGQVPASARDQMPPPAQRQPGKTYWSPTGPVQWNGKGWVRQ